MYSTSKPDLTSIRASSVNVQTTKNGAILSQVNASSANFTQFAVIGSGTEQGQLPMLLTPTTCDSIERTLLELGGQSFGKQNGLYQPGSSVKHEYKTAGSDFTGDDSSTSDDWESGVKIVRTQSGAEYSAASPAYAGYDSSTTTKSSGRQTGPRKPRKDVQLTAEEEERRRLRRERNKQAAAKCRQKRVDLTNQLLAETETLESEQSRLQEEIKAYQREKDELEFILETHRLHCGAAVVSKPQNVSMAVCMAASGTENKINFSVAPVNPSGGGGCLNVLPDVMTSAGPLVKMETHDRNAVTSGPVSAHAQLPAIVMAPAGATANVSICRPNSFPMSGMRTVAMAATPNGFNLLTIGLESLIDGHTGLTPITGIPSCSTAAIGSQSSVSISESLLAASGEASVVAL